MILSLFFSFCRLPVARCRLPLFGLLLFPSPASAYDSIQLKQTITAPSTLKSFNPTGIAVDRTGRLWVTDAQNETLFLFAPNGDLLQQIGRHGSDKGEFLQPRGIAVDSEGNVYVADAGNQRIQTFSADGKPRSSFGEKGTGYGQFRNPWAISVSADGVLVVADRSNQRLQLFSEDGVFLHTIETGSEMEDVAIDVQGRIYTTNAKLHQIEQWSSAGQLLRSFTGSEPGVKSFGKPQNLAVTASGWLYVTDAAASHFRELDVLGHTQGTFGRPGSGAGQFSGLEGIAARGESLYICDTKNHRITVFSLSHQTPLSALPPVPAARLQVARAGTWAIDADHLVYAPNGQLYALSSSRGEIMTLDSGKAVAQLNLKKSLSLTNGASIVMDPSGTSLFITDEGANRIIKCNLKGELLAEIGKGTTLFKKGQGELSKPQGLAMSSEGALFVADTGNGRFQVFNDQGLFLFSAGEKGSGSGQLKWPMGIAWDKDRIYVADSGNHKIIVFNASGRYLYEIGGVGPETLTDPRQIAVDREGNLFVLDVGRSRLLMYDPQGVYVGGFGSFGKAEGFLNHPRGFALNEQGSLVVAEEGRLQTFRVGLLPPTPTGLRASSGEGYVELHWEPVKTRFPSKYVVYRNIPLSEPQRVKETVETAFNDDTLLPDTTYSYTVVAQSVQGAMSVPSALVQAIAKASTNGPRLEIVSAQIDDIFSAHYKYYGRVPVGHVLIRNNGPTPFQKIKVSFAIQGYMDFPSETAIPELHANEQKEVPLLATFNNRILEVTETTPIQAQVRLSFYQGLQESSVVRNLPFKLFSRNTLRWDKKDRFAAFVTPNDPPVIDFSRGIVLPFAEVHRGAPVPAPLMTAWAVFEGLGAYGISYVPRPNNPYDRVSLDSSTIDTVQFARETLARKSGDCADVAALLASALESLTVTTCALDAPGHLFLMFDTGETQKEKVGFPESWLVPYAGSYWIPLEATLLGSPFMQAWKQGAEEYRRWSEQGKVSPIDIHLAWGTFEPATLAEIPSTIKPPSRTSIEEKFLKDWKALADFRWESVQAEAKQALAKTPTSGQPWLTLGLWAAEFKKYEEAHECFFKARADASTSAAAYNNLGNLDFLQKDWDLAESHYKQAIEKDPNDPQIFLNLARVRLKKGLPQKAAGDFEHAIHLDPGLKERYGDVSALTP